ASSSTFKRLPKSLEKYPSEYAYLFSQLDKFQSEPSENFADYYLIPHIVRRVVEGYVGMRVPNISSLKKKVDYLIEESSQKTQVYKYINEYSHQNQPQRNKRHPDLSETKKIVEVVVNSLKEKDQEHCEALLHL
ncbi:AAA family ATPase, partial [Candidatus Bipolaricaulota bacterium]|nr:AAA family ATPase [Candidatus Bipolaricaulota bacterium]